MSQSDTWLRFKEGKISGSSKTAFTTLFHFKMGANGGNSVIYLLDYIDNRLANLEKTCM